jgi:membrane-associated phospholipid phosphatase
MKHFAVETSRWMGLALLCLAGSADARASDRIEQAGNFLELLLPATAGGLTLGFQDYQGSLQLAESMALSFGVTTLLKHTVEEQRPNGGSESFPSEHASISFSAAEFLRKRYGWEYGVPAYAAASFVAYSRVEAGQHHPRDVVAGAAIGIASSFIFTKPYKGWHLQAEAGEKYYGLRLSRLW